MRISNIFVLLLMPIMTLKANVVTHQKIEAKNLPKYVVSERVPEWMRVQIEKDLSPFKERGIRKNFIENIYHHKSFHWALLWVHVKNGKLSYSMHKDIHCPDRVTNLIEALRFVVASAKIKDLELIISLHDGLTDNDINDSVPVMMFSRHNHFKSGILIPDFEALGGYDELRAQILAGEAYHPWDKKEEIAFWRGTTTGGFFTMENWSSFPRAKLVLTSLEHPADVDARFTLFCQCDRDVQHVMKKKGMVGKYCSPQNHLAYKYLVDVDGNANSYSRCFWILFSNSVSLKQESEWTQWYYSVLKPWVHYIPLKEDVSDILDKINWAREHDEEAREIAENATDFANENLMQKDVYLYLFHLIKEYAKLVNMSS